jgi:MFS family permease
MLTAEHLDAAVVRGIVSPGQRQQLLALAADIAPPVDDDETVPDEALRLVGGGNDLFVTVGIVLLFSGALFALSALLGAQSAVLAAIIAVAVWLVAEIVTRQRRMRLSSTVLALGFMAALSTIIGEWLAGRIDFRQFENNPLLITTMRGEFGWWSLAIAAALVIAATAYFWRFRVPILAAVVAIVLTVLAFVQTALFLYDGVTTGQVAVPLSQDIPDVIANALYIPLICGFIVFAVAVALDLHDRERRTVWSDCAFWLHVVAAPMLVHPLFILATGQDVVFGNIEPDTTASIMLGLLISGFVYVALAIDRRSLLVPTLAYFGSLGIYYLVNSAANQTGIPPFALILLAIGALVIMFGAGWQRIRRVVVGTSLPHVVLNRLPPIRA